MSYIVYVAWGKQNEMLHGFLLCVPEGKHNCQSPKGLRVLQTMPSACLPCSPSPSEPVMSRCNYRCQPSLGKHISHSNRGDKHLSIKPRPPRKLVQGVWWPKVAPAWWPRFRLHMCVCFSTEIDHIKASPSHCSSVALYSTLPRSHKTFNN